MFSFHRIQNTNIRTAEIRYRTYICKCQGLTAICYNWSLSRRNLVLLGACRVEICYFWGLLRRNLLLWGLPRRNLLLWGLRVVWYCCGLPHRNLLLWGLTAQKYIMLLLWLTVQKSVRMLLWWLAAQKSVTMGGGLPDRNLFLMLHPILWQLLHFWQSPKYLF